MARIALGTLAATGIVVAGMVLVPRLSRAPAGGGGSALRITPAASYLLAGDTARLAATVSEALRRGIGASGASGAAGVSGAAGRGSAGQGVASNGGELGAAGARAGSRARDEPRARGPTNARGAARSAIDWASSNAGVAAVDSVGLVTALAYGTAAITASAGGAADTAWVTVGPAVLVGAGDISICGSRWDDATAALLDSIPGLVFTAGDNAYNDGTTREYERCYDRSWGRHKRRTRPAVGNHDFHTDSAAAYYAYFGAAAGVAGKGYYSYELGGWHIVVLNSEIDVSAGSAQERWLRADLAAHPARCTLAYWHRPLFGSGRYEQPVLLKPLWDALYDAGAEIVINGHDHAYEEFTPLTPDGMPDPARGIREFIVGTGGAGLYEQGDPLPTSEVRQTSTHGVLRVELGADGYAWEFVPAYGGLFTSAGSGRCH